LFSLTVHFQKESPVRQKPSHPVTRDCQTECWENHEFAAETKSGYAHGVLRSRVRILSSGLTDCSEYIELVASISGISVTIRSRRDQIATNLDQIGTNQVAISSRRYLFLNRIVALVSRIVELVASKQ